MRMARVSATQGEGDVAARIRARRGGTLRPLDQMLLHSPPLADGWNSLLGAIRSRISLDPATREILVLRIAVLNRAGYEWEAHEPPARQAGVTDDQLKALRGAGRPKAPPTGDQLRAPRTGDQPKALHGDDRAPFDAAQLAALDYAEAMTTGIEVPEPVFEALRPHFDEAAIVELTAVAAVYNMVSRFLVALEVTA
jgi:AhpD family alkylhydroperoxidase